MTQPTKARALKPSLEIDLKTLSLLSFMHALFWGNFYLYFNRPGPLWLHMGASIIAIHCAFTIWHEAAHSNVSNRSWINNVVGILGMLPYKTPYFMQKWIHLQHHKMLNQQNDPNFMYVDGSFLTLPFRYIRGPQYIKGMMKEDPLSSAQKRWDKLWTLIILGVYIHAAFRGYFWDLILIWAIPFGIAKVIMDWYINYIPHVGLPADRYKGTRIITASWLTPLILLHNYHAIHHLWPGYPWHEYKKIFHEKKEELMSKGVPVESSPFVAEKA